MTYDTISPLDYRYYKGNPELYNLLRPYLSEEASVRYQARVEAAIARSLAERGICTKQAADEIAEAAEKVTAAEVYEEDARIRHLTRALVNCIRNRVSEAAKPYVHLTATSFDIVDTANAARYRAFAHDALVPSLKRLLRVLIGIAEREKSTVQVGRTHGQHAVPITFGYVIAGYVDRLGNATREIARAADGLRGKLSGAVGSHASQRLFVDDPVALEKETLALLGLKAGRHATQVVEPEYLLNFLHHVIVAQGILADLADDMRHLQRSEIGEVAERFGSAQVGSSTMPHKRNPWNFENVKSMWKAVMPRIITQYMDQLCEHQRDLSNSASSRFVPEILALATESTVRMERIMGKLVVDNERLAENFAQSKEMIIAEPLYLVLAAVGHPDAHEYVRKQTLESQRTGTPLRELVLRDASVAGYVAKFTPLQRAAIERPETYLGVCEKKTEEICAYWRQHG